MEPDIPICEQCGKPCTEGWCQNEQWMPVNKDGPLICVACERKNRDSLDHPFKEGKS